MRAGDFVQPERRAMQAYVELDLLLMSLERDRASVDVPTPIGATRQTSRSSMQRHRRCEWDAPRDRAQDDRKQDDRKQASAAGHSKITEEYAAFATFCVIRFGESRVFQVHSGPPQTLRLGASHEETSDRDRITPWDHRL
jgi:hypothetical protein